MKGYNDKVADEITKAFGALSLHGVLQVRHIMLLVICKMAGPIFGPANVLLSYLYKTSTFFP